MTILFATPGALDGGFPYGHSVVRVRAPLVSDPYSAENTARDWAAATRVTTTAVQFSAVSSMETTELDGSRIVTRESLWSQVYDLDILASDRIELAGRTYEVIGDGSRWANPFTGWRAGAEFPLERVS